MSQVSLAYHIVFYLQLRGWIHWNVCENYHERVQQQQVERVLQHHNNNKKREALVAFIVRYIFYCSVLVSFPLSFYSGYDQNPDSNEWTIEEKMRGRKGSHFISWDCLSMKRLCLQNGWNWTMSFILERETQVRVPLLSSCCSSLFLIILSCYYCCLALDSKVSYSITDEYGQG